jgi:hypothetical protein
VEVLILDQSGHGKTSPCSVVENRSSNDQEMFDDSVQIVSPPPPQIIDLTSSDDEDDIVREGAKEPCRVQKRVTRSCTKTQKMASTLSPSPKSGIPILVAYAFFFLYCHILNEFWSFCA